VIEFLKKLSQKYIVWTYITHYWLFISYKI
jgi:hypothetical protein